MLSNSQEILLEFLSTHLAMVSLLMPWKRTSIGTVNHLWTLFDMINVDTWKVGMVDGVAVYDDDLGTKTNVFIGLAVTVLVSSIISFAASVLHPRETGIRLSLSFVNFVLGVVLLSLVVAFQEDFDKYFKVLGGGDTAYDSEQMFLSVGVLAGYVFLNLVCLVDKVKELM